MSAPVLIGLTGSIGMGKSTTAAMFAAHGLPVWDADAAVHRLYAEGGAAVAPLAALCPAALKDGEIDRAALKQWIRDDPAAFGRIEAVVHPLVAADRAEFIAAQSARFILLDIPLLFETGAEERFDLVAVVSTTPEEQRRRVMARPGMSEQMFQSILAKQLPDAQKRERADVVIDTTTMESARHDVDMLVARLRKEYGDA
ncbi:dephospho-CoA kinase [Oceaniglobus trochenteri]|uniref:dephospho-CoA kinase n=1 Tax=Oceaniglobus trochenteri TaxID=2763260 RepID=UPI001CFFFE52|nr:dephospho-CoA kinase [Oceaniglobus trochenteri]